MPPEENVTISREQYDLQARSTALLDRLLADPKAAPSVEAEIARINPDAKFPYKERREAFFEVVNTARAEDQAKIAALEAKLTAQETAAAAAVQANAEASMMARIKAEQTKRGFSDEMMEKVIQTMRDNNNPDVSAAAALVAESIPKPAPAQGYDFLPSTVDAFGSVSGDDTWKKLHENPDNWLTNELRTISRDPEFARLGNG